MTPDDSRCFFQGLGLMGIHFSDELTETRQRIYWEVLRDEIIIDEWEYAYRQAMFRETFHKVPLPAQLMDYVREYRQHQKDEATRQRRMVEEEALSLATAQRLGGMSPQEWKEEQDRAFHEAQASLNALFGTDWRERADMQQALERIERQRRLRKHLYEEDDVE